MQSITNDMGHYFSKFRHLMPKKQDSGLLLQTPEAPSSSHINRDGYGVGTGPIAETVARIAEKRPIGELSPESFRGLKPTIWLLSQ